MKLGIIVLAALIALACYVTWRAGVEDRALPNAPRAAAAAHLHPAIQTATLDQRSTEKLKVEERVVDRIRGEDLFVGGTIANKHCSIDMDGDVYSEGTEQDKALLRRIFATLCAGSYRFAGRSLPSDGLPFSVYNRAGEEIYFDTAIAAGAHT